MKQLKHTDEPLIVLGVSWMLSVLVFIGLIVADKIWQVIDETALYISMEYPWPSAILCFVVGLSIIIYTNLPENDTE
jgi:hypothetical protein